MSSKQAKSQGTFISFSDLTPSSTLQTKKRGKHQDESQIAPVSTFSTDTNVDKSTGRNISPVYTGNDPNLSVLCKKLLKKDGITRIKAISGILEAIKGVRVYISLCIYSS